MRKHKEAIELGHSVVMYTEAGSSAYLEILTPSTVDDETFIPCSDITLYGMENIIKLHDALVKIVADYNKRKVTV